MKPKLPEWPKWIETAIQGLSFWIGHRHSLFRYPLTEGALVAELCNLIQSNLPSDLGLFPEQLYRNILLYKTKIITKNARVDLVVCENNQMKYSSGKNIAQYVRFVFEVKRSVASRSLIDEDLKRLYNFIDNSNDSARAFLIITSESSQPKRFVKNGKSILGKNPINGVDGHYRVRRTCKASSSFSGIKRAHYIALIEVFKNSHQKKM